ncbi:pentatricopeptide repeat-containing family protein, partial [Striga asiatica]
MITTYIQTGQEKQRINFFSRMLACGISPNEYTYAAVISGVANMANLEWGQQLHEHVLLVGLVESLSVSHSIMTLYSKCGLPDSALKIFRQMTARDVISWSTIIAGHSQGGHAKEAFELFSQMRKEGPRPTEFVESSVLSVCGSMSILDQGKQLHAFVLSVGLDQTTRIPSSLINMYLKCGCILEAAKVFSLTINDDIISWTAMINGYAEHGLSREAIELFERIPDAGLRPDSVTFIGVLGACSHAGLLGLGSCYFDSVIEKYRIYPCKAHYGCMIDLFCRAGRLEEAERMMREISFEKDVVVWSSVLRASRECGDVERGRVVAEEVIWLDPECGEAHVTLANMYASDGRWKEAAEVRRLMRWRGVVKEPGWSWVKVEEERVLAFVAGDRNHPRCEEVYGMSGMVYCSSEELSFEEVDSVDAKVFLRAENIWFSTDWAVQYSLRRARRQLVGRIFDHLKSTADEADKLERRWTTLEGVKDRKTTASLWRPASLRRRHLCGSPFSCRVDPADMGNVPRQRLVTAGDAESRRLLAGGRRRGHTSGYDRRKTATTGRHNKITGVAYKNDLAIMAWKLMNEPRCNSNLKYIDQKHLLEIGLKGFYGQTFTSKDQDRSQFQH